jgi:hypothetical protein
MRYNSLPAFAVVDFNDLNQDKLPIGVFTILHTGLSVKRIFLNARHPHNPHHLPPNPRIKFFDPSTYNVRHTEFSETVAMSAVESIVWGHFIRYDTDALPYKIAGQP